MKILYVLQHSIFGNDNKWKSADSNVNMMIGFFKALKQTSRWHDLYIDVVIANIKDFSDIKSYDELFKDNHVRYIEYDFPVNAFLNRQHFNVYFWKQLIENNYDIIINNITEQSRNIKTLIEVAGKKTKLVTQCFWMDCPEIGEPKVPTSYSYDWRIFDGYECSDLCVFTCDSVIRAFAENALHKFNKKYLRKIIGKSAIWDFGFSTLEAREYRVAKQKNKKAVILFLNRLSMINYTHHKEFIEAINNIAKQRDDFEVIFTNPSEKFTNKWLKENCANVKLLRHPLNREEYWELLYRSDISVHLFTVERYSGCGLRESIQAENITIVADCFEQKNLIDFPELRVPVSEGSICVADLEKALNYALDNPQLVKDFAKIRKINILRCSFETQADHILDKLYRLIS